MQSKEICEKFKLVSEVNGRLLHYTKSLVFIPRGHYMQMLYSLNTDIYNLVYRLLLLKVDE